MEVKEWIKENFLMSRDGDEIIFYKDNYVIGSKLDFFSSVFGEVIKNAIGNNLDVYKEIRDSDPNNELGYNDLI